MSCRHYLLQLKEEDRHFINSEEHNNCVLCLVHDKGPMTQEEVAFYFGCSKMRISQLEKQAREKLHKRLKKYDFHYD